MRRLASTPKVLCWNKGYPFESNAVVRTTPRRCSLFRDGYDYEAAGAVHMRNLKWKSWGGATTVARGQFAEPMDADNPWKPITVRLKRPVKDCGRTVYSKAVFRTRGAGKFGFPIWTCPGGTKATSGQREAKARLQKCGFANFEYTRAQVRASGIKCRAARQIARKWLHSLDPGDCQVFPCYQRVEHFRCRFSGTEIHLKLRCQHMEKAGRRVYADWGG